ncbi:MAG: helix-turn-helix transcriptional regulator [Planctomycetes bacterium]|nr:helix-turn-helix transcriptional regulator [Planctomycetota bacterium]
MAETIIARGLAVPMGFAGSLPLADRGVVSAGIGSVRRNQSVVCADPTTHTLVYSADGAGLLLFGGHAVPLRRNDLWVIPAGIVYTLTSRSPEWKLMWFHLRPIVRWTHLDGGQPYQRTAGQANRMVPVMAGLISEASALQQDRVKMGKLFAEILVIFLERRLRPDRDGHGAARERLAEVWAAVDHDLSRPWTVADLASLFGVSAPHFHRLVQGLHRSSPLKIVTQMRMARAQALLSDSDHRLATIAAAVGYDDAFSFSRAFKHCTGVSPRAFRAGEGSGRIRPASASRARP